MMKKILFILITFLFFENILAQVGVNTTSPTATLDVNGNLRVRDLRENDYTNHFILLADSLGNVKKAIANTVTGTLNETYYLQGTSELEISSGTRADVPGMSFTHVVPAEISSQTLVFLVTGYAAKPGGGISGSSQGVFELYQGTTKISSAYVSVATGSGSDNPLVNLPVPCTMMKSITLTPGTYTFKISYKSWAATAVVNKVPSDYMGYDNDSEAMLTKMNVMIYNN